MRAGEGIRLDAHQLCEALGCPIAPTAPLGAVIVIDETLPAGNPRRLEPDEAIAVLATALLGSRAGVYASEVFSRIRLRGSRRYGGQARRTLRTLRTLRT